MIAKVILFVILSLGVLFLFINFALWVRDSSSKAEAEKLRSYRNKIAELEYLKDIAEEYGNTLEYNKLNYKVLQYKDKYNKLKKKIGLPT